MDVKDGYEARNVYKKSNFDIHVFDDDDKQQIDMLMQLQGHDKVIVECSFKADAVAPKAAVLIRKLLKD